MRPTPVPRAASPAIRLRLLATAVAALAALAASAALAGPAGAQTAAPPPVDEPYWVHVTPGAGVTAISRPGQAGGAVASLQLELSHARPVGFGITGGYWFPTDAPADPDGPFLEATFAYRFHLRARGHLSPYAGPVAGAIRDDTGETREIRGFFGGRAGIDIPIRGPWPALRIEASYRHLSEAAGRGTGDSTLLLLGGRWSVPFGGDEPARRHPASRRAVESAAGFR